METETVCAVVKEFVGQKFLDGHLCEHLGVEVSELLGILTAGIFKSAVEFLAFCLILVDVDLGIPHLSHSGVVSEEVTAVGQRVAYDEGKQCKTDDDDQEHRLASDFL